MNIPSLLLPLALCALVLLALVLTWARGFNRPRRNPRVNAALAFAFHAPLGFVNALLGSTTLCLANIGEGQHEGNITKRSDAVIASRYLLAKIGSDANHVNLAGVGDIPLGVITDEAAAIEDIVNVALFGASECTLKVQAAAAIAQGDFVVAGAAGQIRTLPVAAGTYYIIGRALTAAAAQGDIVEIDPSVPIQRVVP